MTDNLNLNQTAIAEAVSSSQSTRVLIAMPCTAKTTTMFHQALLNHFQSNDEMEPFVSLTFMLKENRANENTIRAISEYDKGSSIQMLQFSNLYDVNGDVYGRDFYTKLSSNDKYFSNLTFGKNIIVDANLHELNPIKVRSVMLMSNVLKRYIFNSSEYYKKSIFDKCASFYHPFKDFNSSKNKFHSEDILSRMKSDVPEYLWSDVMEHIEIDISKEYLLRHTLYDIADEHAFVLTERLGVSNDDPCIETEKEWLKSEARLLEIMQHMIVAPRFANERRVVDLSDDVQAILQWIGVE